MIRLTTKSIPLLAALAFVFAAGPAHADNFGASLGFSFADDNVLRDAGETRISSPNAYFGQSPESYFSRLGDGGFGASTLDLHIYGAVEGLHPLILPEGAVVLRLNPAEGDYADNGTYLKFNYFFEPAHKTGFSIEMFPIDSDRMRLGFHHDISWGGTDVFPAHFRKGLVPGLKIQVDMGSWYLFAGVKTALVRSPTEDILDNPGGNTNKIVERTSYGVLAGAGVDIWEGLRFEVNGGWFYKGSNTRANVLGERIDAGGFSGQLSYRYGLPIGRRIDLRLYQEDPLRNDILSPERYGSGVSFYVALEGTGLLQTLEDPDRVRSTFHEWSYAGMLSFQLKWDHLRVHIEGVLRSLTYITFNVPGFVPYQGLPENVETQPEIYGSLSLDYHIDVADLTVALTLGVLRPSTYKGVPPLGPFSNATLQQGVHKVVVRGAASGDWDILPAGSDVLPVFYMKTSLKWTFGENFAAIAELTYGRDPNLAQVFRDARGHAIRQFDDPNILGFGLLARLSY